MSPAWLSLQDRGIGYYYPVTASRAGRQPWLRAVSSTAPVPLVSVDRIASDEALIEAVARGDAKVAGQLYDRLVGVVNRSLLRIFGRREPDHDDLVQATFEQIIITLSKRRYVGACSLSAWASTVALHVALKALRSRRRERRVLAWGEDPSTELRALAPNTDIERDTGLRREIDGIRGHLAEMDENKANTFLLHDVFGYDLAEIAVLTSVSVAAAQSRLVRGRKELYARVEEARAQKRAGAPEGTE
jgi:RNA polymerase sigma-70 factor, ECF subfamily